MYAALLRAPRRSRPGRRSRASPGERYPRVQSLPESQGRAISGVPSRMQASTASATSSALLIGWEKAMSATRSSSSPKKPVSTGPGETTETVMPRGRSSSRAAREKARRPILVAPYVACRRIGTMPAREATLTMRPPAGISSAAARVRTTGAVRFTATIAARSRGSTSRSGPRRWKPALLTSASRPPIFAATVPGSAAQAAASATSQTKISAAPAGSIAAASRNVRSVRATSATRHPCAPSLRATDSPIPADAPVTSAMLMRARISRRGAGPAHGEGGAVSLHRAHRDLSAVGVDDLLHDVEAEAQPGVAARFFGHAALEGMEQAREQVGCDRRPLVVDLEDHLGVCAAERDLHHRRRRAVAERVGDQVGDGLRGAVGIERAARLAGGSEADCPLRVEHLHAVDHLVAERDQIRLPPGQRKAGAPARAGVVEQVVDHPLDAVRVVGDPPQRVALLALQLELALEQLGGGEDHPERV